MKKPNTSKSQKLWRKAKQIIPGGTQLLSKRPEMFLPEQWPAYVKKAKGVEVTDMDGNTYIDMSIMAVGACILGYADEDVNKAVKKVIDEGSIATLNSPEEVELAELLLNLHPWADMVRYARTSGEANSIAVRIARGYTKKDTIAFCGYHGWSDWYLASNLADNKNLDGHLLPGLNPLGVPRGLIKTAIPFRYNHVEELEQIVQAEDIGTIIMEPVRHTEPEDNFLQKVRKIADEIGAVLIFDEVSAAWRMHLGGAHLMYGVNPDVAVFGKAMSNGFPMAAVIGKKEIMNVAQESFISSTYWTERVGPAATLAAIQKMREKNVPSHIFKIGELIAQGWQELAKKHSLDVTLKGPNALITFAFNYENAQEVKTLFTQEMLKRGFLASQTVYVSYAHGEEHVRAYMEKVDEVFGILKKAIEENKVPEFLEGPVAHLGFQRLT